MDERFFLHRYKSTSHAAMVAALAMGGLFFYELIARGTIRWDLQIILTAMAMTKIVAMIWYRRHD
jgi:hypothetical protein